MGDGVRVAPAVTCVVLWLVWIENEVVENKEAGVTHFPQQRGWLGSARTIAFSGRTTTSKRPTSTTVSGTPTGSEYSYPI